MQPATQGRLVFVLGPLQVAGGFRGFIGLRASGVSRVFSIIDTKPYNALKGFPGLSREPRWDFGLLNSPVSSPSLPPAPFPFPSWGVGFYYEACIKNQVKPSWTSKTENVYLRTFFRDQRCFEE